MSIYLPLNCLTRVPISHTSLLSASRYPRSHLSDIMADYSHTKLSTFEQCRYKYKLKYIDKVKTEDRTRSIETFMGSLVHEALEKLYTDLGYCKVDSLDDIVDFYNRRWDEDFNDSVTIAKKEYAAENYRAIGEKCIRDYYESHKPFDDMTILGLETEDAYILPNGRTYDVRIDKLACKGDEYFVCDYKTNGRMKEQIDADKDRQLAMYMAWVRDNYSDAKSIILIWHMLRFDKDVTSSRTDEQISSLVDETVKLIDEIESCDSWPLNVSNLCDYCEFRHLCPEFRHLYVVEEMTPEQMKEDRIVPAIDEMASIDLRIKELDSQIKDLKAEKESISERLIGYAVENGLDALYGTEIKCSVKRKDDISVSEDNKEKLKSTLLEKGMSDYLQIGSSKLYSDVRKGALSDTDVLSLIEAKENYSITTSKIKDKK